MFDTKFLLLESFSPFNKVKFRHMVTVIVILLIYDVLTSSWVG